MCGIGWDREIKGETSSTEQREDAEDAEDAGQCKFIVSRRKGGWHSFPPFFYFRAAFGGFFASFRSLRPDDPRSTLTYDLVSVRMAAFGALTKLSNPLWAAERIPDHRYGETGRVAGNSMLRNRVNKNKKNCQLAIRNKHIQCGVCQNLVVRTPKPAFACRGSIAKRDQWYPLAMHPQ